MTPQQQSDATAAANAARESCTCGLFRPHCYACLDCWVVFTDYRPPEPMT